MVSADEDPTERKQATAKVAGTQRKCLSRHKGQGLYKKKPPVRTTAIGFSWG